MLPLRAPAVALALALIGCAPAPVSADLRAAPSPSFPPSLTTVPANVKPVLFDQNPTSGAAPVGDDVAFVRVLPDGNTVDVDFTRIAQAPFEPDAFVIDPGALTSGEPLFIQAVCDDCKIAGSWDVSDARDDAPLDLGAPRPQVTAAVGFNYESWDVNNFSVTVNLPPLDGAALYRFTGDEVDAVPQMPPQGLEDGSRTVVIHGGAPRRSCFTPSARDAAGNVTVLPKVCADLDPHVNARGCANAGAPPPLALVLAALLFARRSRRPATCQAAAQPQR